MATQPNGDGRRSAIRRVDDAIFAVEQTIVWTFLAAMTVMVFLDVVYRRVSAADSKTGDLIARLFSIDNPDAIASLQANVAPIVNTVLGLGLLYFGFWTAERHRQQLGKESSAARPVIFTLVSGAVLAGLAWLMGRQDFASKHFYLLLWFGGAVPWLVSLVRNKPEGWQTRVGAIVVTSLLFTWLALNYFPEGYSWSKELSSILLIWVGFLGASVCAHEGKHIQMGALQKLIPDKYERYVRAGGFLLAAGFCALLAILGWNYLQEARELEGVFEQTNIPDWIATAAVPAAFALTMLRCLGGAISALTGGDYGLAPVDESLLAAQKSAQAGAKS